MEIKELIDRLNQKELSRELADMVYDVYFVEEARQALDKWYTTNKEQITYLKQLIKLRTPCSNNCKHAVKEESK